MATWRSASQRIARVVVALLPPFAAACTSSGPAHDGGHSTDAIGGNDAPAGTGVDPFAACGGRIVRADGTIDPDEYTRQANATDAHTIDCRLGPRHGDLPPNPAATPAVTLAEAVTHACDHGYNCSAGYEAGPAMCVAMSGCYGSDQGQVMYLPSAPSEPGVDRIQTYAWESGVHCYSPRALAQSPSHPDPQVAQAGYTSFAGAPLSHPLAMTRNPAAWDNDAVMIFGGNLIATSGTTTTGSSGTIFRFPADKVPTSVALTSSNEFLLVTIWDTTARRGQLAVLAARGPTPTSHTWPYYGLFNAGGFTSFKLLGYVDLPFATPTSVAAASNGHWASPSDTAGMNLSDLQFATRATDGSVSCDMGRMQSFARTAGDWSSVVATRGYAVVASRWENAVAFVDLAPLFAYYRAMYFGSMASCLETAHQFDFDATHPAIGAQPPADAFPYTFEHAPSQAPQVVATFPVPAPRAVLAGARLDRWSRDRHRAWAVSQDGTMHVFHAGALIWEWYQMGDHDAEITEAPHETATVATCRNPTAMHFVGNSAGSDSARAAAAPVGAGPVPLQTMGSSAGQPIGLDGFNGDVAVVCRGDQEIDYVAGWTDDTGHEGQAVFWRFHESHINDPVEMDFADRADIRAVADFDGHSVLTYRFSSVSSADCAQPRYDVPAGGEFGGAYMLPGPVLAVSTTNVN